MRNMIFLIRHGHTYYNLEDRNGGNPDLTELGKKQSSEIGSILLLTDINKIFTSPLKRSVETAKIIQESHPGVDIEKADELKEIDSGQLDNHTNKDFQNKYPGI
jgi:broad specificity phosphatase PhoE